MLNTLLVVGFGGFIGAILRMFSINLVNKFFPYSISLGTLFVNVLGSFIIGLLFSYCKGYFKKEHVTILNNFSKNPK
ncbi:CrcB family protein [Campylobacter jejuni]